MSLSSPASFCTFAQTDNVHELYAMLLTLSIHHPNAPVFVGVDSGVKDAIGAFVPAPRLAITWILPDGVNGAIANALDMYPDTLYLDPHMIVCAPIVLDRAGGNTTYTSDTGHIHWTNRQHAEGANPAEIPPEYNNHVGNRTTDMKCVYLDTNQYNDYLMFVLQHLNARKQYRELACIHRVMNKGWKILIPKQPQPGMWTHTNDSFRELAVLLQARHKTDLIVEHSALVRNVYLEPTVLLYDRDTLQWFDGDAQQAHLVFLGNNDIVVDGAQLTAHGINVRSWIYWARRPMILETLIARGLGSKGYGSRPIMSMFIGNIENSVQAAHRTAQDWGSYVERYVCTRGTKHAFTPKEYLEQLGEARFGLSLRGYGSKCHREIELMSVGTVPIITPGVNMGSYPVPPQKDVHYLSVERAEEIPALCASISEERWQEMSNACKTWFMDYCHSTNVWRNLIENIIYDV